MSGLKVFHCTTEKYTTIFFVLKIGDPETKAQKTTNIQMLNSNFCSPRTRGHKIKAEKFRISNRIPIFSMCILTVESPLLEFIAIDSKELMSFEREISIQVN